MGRQVDLTGRSSNGLDNGNVDLRKILAGAPNFQELNSWKGLDELQRQLDKARVMALGSTGNGALSIHAGLPLCRGEIMLLAALDGVDERRIPVPGEPFAVVLGTLRSGGMKDPIRHYGLLHADLEREHGGSFSLFPLVHLLREFAAEKNLLAAARAGEVVKAAALALWLRRQGPRAANAMRMLLEDAGALLVVVSHAGRTIVTMLPYVHVMPRELCSKVGTVGYR